MLRIFFAIRTNRFAALCASRGAFTASIVTRKFFIIVGTICIVDFVLVLINFGDVDNRSRIALYRFLRIQRIGLLSRQPFDGFFAARHFARRNDFDANVVFVFDLCKFASALVLQLLRNIGVQFDVHAAEISIRRPSIDFAHEIHANRLGTRNRPTPATRRASEVHALRQRLTNALSVDFEQAIGAYPLDFIPRLIARHRIAHHALDIALMFPRTHIDKVDDDEPPDISHSQLPPNFGRRFEIRMIRRQILIFAFCRMRRIDVDRRQSLGRVDDDIPTAGQRHLPRINLLDLLLNAKPRENRHLVFIELDLLFAACNRRLHIRHRAFITRLIVDEDFVNRRIEIIPHHRDDDILVVIEQLRAIATRRLCLDFMPQLHERLGIA